MLVINRYKWTIRLFGIGLLSVLIWQLDIAKTGAALRTVRLDFVILAIILTLPMILLKSLRWRDIVLRQGASYGKLPALLAYFGGIFIGLITPGRLGEFSRTLYVMNDCRLSAGKAFASVFTDRLFDLYALTLVGGTGLWLMLFNRGWWSLIEFWGFFIILTILMLLILRRAVFRRVCQFILNLSLIGARKAALSEWLNSFHEGLQIMSLKNSLTWLTYTCLAYSIFFFQAYLLARSVDLLVSFPDVIYAVALGSLVTLLPISISGIGTREATVIAFMHTRGIAAEPTLAFLFLFFVTFYIASGLMGAAAWSIKPLPISIFGANKDRLIETHGKS